MVKKYLLIIIISVIVVSISWFIYDKSVLKNEGKTVQKVELDNKNLKKAIFAGGCFWCMEEPFQDQEGVDDVIVGYTGGSDTSPTYKKVSSGITGHKEAVLITYNPEKISYEKLLDIFWRQIDPTDARGQFVDKGTQYTSAIFYEDEEQKQIAEKSKNALEQTGRHKAPLVTEILPASEFYKAEEYHQDYAKKNPKRYKFYRSGSGRDQYLDKIWGKNRERSHE